MKKINLKQLVIVFISAAFILSACDDNNSSISGAYTNGAFVTNEGAFGSGNGSVSFYSYGNDSLYNNIFSSVNTRVLGDVVQSISIHKDKAYIVINGSNKVEVANSYDFIEQGVIKDVVSPRYFLGLDNEKAYVSQWGDNGCIKVIDLSSLTVTKTITTGAGSERMIVYNNLVYVANSGGYANNNTISVINSLTDEVVKTITLDGDSPRSLVLDSNNNIWVLCAGYIDYSDMSETPSKLVRINPTTNEVDETITIGESLHPTCLAISKNRNNLFYGGGYGVQGLFKMSIDDNTVPTSPLIDKSFYGFNINPETGVIYAMEAPSFTANGTLYRYEANGTLLGSYEAGIGPNGAGFKKK